MVEVEHGVVQVHRISELGVADVQDRLVELEHGQVAQDTQDRTGYLKREMSTVWIQYFVVLRTNSCEASSFCSPAVSPRRLDMRRKMCKGAALPEGERSFSCFGHENEVFIHHLHASHRTCGWYMSLDVV